MTEQRALRERDNAEVATHDRFKRNLLTARVGAALFWIAWVTSGVGCLCRRPVARAISRAFSWRAWCTGVGATAWAGGLLYGLTPFKRSPWGAISMGLMAGGSGTLGGFAMHALKRDAGVRSWGVRASVTGAVGLLNRVAPLCFAAPVFVHSVRWYLGF